MLQYECTIEGGEYTVWMGSAFNCDLNYIILIHSQFMQDTQYGRCNSGSLIGYSLRVKNGSYTSQLNVTVSRELDETSIECVRENSTHPQLSIGRSIVQLKGNLDIKIPNGRKETFVVIIIEIQSIVITADVIV